METLFSIENVPMETVLEFLGFNNGNDLRWQHSVCLVMNDENLNLGEFKARIYMNQTILEEKQTKELDKQDTWSVYLSSNKIIALENFSGSCNTYNDKFTAFY